MYFLEINGCSISFDMSSSSKQKTMNHNNKIKIILYQFQLNYKTHQRLSIYSIFGFRLPCGL